MDVTRRRVIGGSLAAASLYATGLRAHPLADKPEVDTAWLLWYRQPARYWVSQGGLICARCGKPEYQHTEVQGGTIAVLRRLASGPDEAWLRLSVAPAQFRELRRIVTAAVSHALDRKPKLLKYLTF